LPSEFAGVRSGFDFQTVEGFVLADLRLRKRGEFDSFIECGKFFGLPAVRGRNGPGGRESENENAIAGLKLSHF